MTITIQLYSTNIPNKTKNKTTKKYLEQNDKTIITDTISFKSIPKEISKSAGNNFLTEIKKALRPLITLFKIKNSTIDFKKMSKKEIKAFLIQRQFRLCFDSSYEKYNIAGKPVNIITKCKKYPEFAKEIFNMKQKDIFNRSRFNEQDIAELFVSYEINPKLTKELLEVKNPDGSAMFKANNIRELVELRNEDVIRTCLKIIK